MSKVMDLIFNLDMFVSNGMEDIGKVKQSLSQAEAAVKKLNASASQTGDYVKLSQSIRRNQETMLAMRQSARMLDTQLASSRTHTQSLQSRYNALKSAQNKLTQSGQKNTRTYQIVTQRLKSVKAELTQAQNQTKNLEREQNRLNASADKLQRSLDNDRTSLASLRDSLGAAGQSTEALIEKQQKQIAQAEKIQAAYSKLESIKSQLTWANFKTDLMGSMGIIKAFEKPIKVNMDFSSAMSSLQSVGRFSDEQYAKLESLAMDLGAKTQFTATEAAKTMEVLKRKGFEFEEIIAAIPDVLGTAAAEGMSLDTAADAIGRITGGLGLEAKDASRIADILAYTSAQHATSIPELVEVFKAAGPTASKVGVSPEQLASMLGVLADKGFSGSEGGKAISSTIARLNEAMVKGKGPVYSALKQLGVAIQTPKGKMREIPDILKDLNEKTAKMGEGTRMGYLSMIFGKNFGPEFIALMEASVKGEVAESEQNFDSGKHVGWSAKTAEIRNDNLQGDVTRLGSAWEGLMIRIGRAIEPINRFVVSTLGEGITKLNEWISKHEELVNWITRLVYVAGGLLVFAKVYKYARLIVGLVSAWANLKAAIAGIEGATKLWTAAQWLLNAAMNANPIGLAIMAIAGLIALGVILYNNWEKISAFGQKMWAGFREKAQGFKEWWDNFSLGNLFSELYDDAVAMIAKLKQPFIDFADWIMEKIGNLNPFNWSLPSWLGGGTPERAERVERGKANLANWDPLSGNLPGFAAGGIVNVPQIAHIAESGPEAIIPLNDKSRGQGLLMQAASRLGMSSLFNNTGSELNGSLNIDMPNVGSNNNNLEFAPVVNITVNASESESRDNNSLAELISSKVRNILDEIASNSMRLSYA